MTSDRARQSQDYDGDQEVECLKIQLKVIQGDQLVAKNRDLQGQWTTSCPYLHISLLPRGQAPVGRNTTKESTRQIEEAVGRCDPICYTLEPKWEFQVETEVALSSITDDCQFCVRVMDWQEGFAGGLGTPEEQQALEVYNSSTDTTNDALMGVVPVNVTPSMYRNLPYTTRTRWYGVPAASADRAAGRIQCKIDVLRTRKPLGDVYPGRCPCFQKPTGKPIRRQATYRPTVAETDLNRACKIEELRLSKQGGTVIDLSRDLTFVRLAVQGRAAEAAEAVSKGMETALESMNATAAETMKSMTLTSSTTPAAGTKKRSMSLFPSPTTTTGESASSSTMMTMRALFPSPTTTRGETTPSTASIASTASTASTIMTMGNFFGGTTMSPTSASNASSSSSRMPMRTSLSPLNLFGGGDTQADTTTTRPAMFCGLTRSSSTSRLFAGLSTTLNPVPDVPLVLASRKAKTISQGDDPKQSVEEEKNMVEAVGDNTKSIVSPSSPEQEEEEQLQANLTSKENANGSKVTLREGSIGTDTDTATATATATAGESRAQAQPSTRPRRQRSGRGKKALESSDRLIPTDKQQQQQQQQQHIESGNKGEHHEQSIMGKATRRKHMVGDKKIGSKDSHCGTIRAAAKNEEQEDEKKKRSKRSGTRSKRLSSSSRHSAGGGDPGRGTDQPCKSKRKSDTSDQHNDDPSHMDHQTRRGRSSSEYNKKRHSSKESGKSESCHADAIVSSYRDRRELKSSHHESSTRTMQTKKNQEKSKRMSRTQSRRSSGTSAREDRGSTSRRRSSSKRKSVRRQSSHRSINAGEIDTAGDRHRPSNHSTNLSCASIDTIEAMMDEKRRAMRNAANNEEYALAGQLQQELREIEALHQRASTQDQGLPKKGKTSKASRSQEPRNAEEHPNEFHPPRHVKSLGSSTERCKDRSQRRRSDGHIQERGRDQSSRKGLKRASLIHVPSPQASPTRKKRSTSRSKSPNRSLSLGDAQEPTRSGSMRCSRSKSDQRRQQQKHRRSTSDVDDHHHDATLQQHESIVAKEQCNKEKISATAEQKVEGVPRASELGVLMDLMYIMGDASEVSVVENNEQSLSSTSMCHSLDGSSSSLAGQSARRAGYDNNSSAHGTPQQEEAVDEPGFYIDEDGFEYYLDETGTEHYKDKDGTWQAKLVPEEQRRQQAVDGNSSGWFRDVDGAKYYLDENGIEYYHEEKDGILWYYSDEGQRLALDAMMPVMGHHVIQDRITSEGKVMSQ